MSQTVDSPLKLISDSINGRDKLLKLAEVANSKGKKKSSRLSFGSKCDKDATHDLAFTSNIEHLVNKDHSLRSSTPIQQLSESESPNTSLNPDVNSNVSCDSACECLGHSSSINESFLETNSPSDLKFCDLKIHEAQSFTSNYEFKSRIPQSVNRRRLTTESGLLAGRTCLNRWPDTEDLSKHNCSKRHSLCRLESLRTSSVNTPQSNRALIMPLTSNNPSCPTDDHHFHLTSVQSHIPVYKPSADHKLPFNNTNNSHFSGATRTSPSDRRFYRTNSFVSYLSDNNRKYSQAGMQAAKYQSVRNAAYFGDVPCRLPQSSTSQALGAQRHFASETLQGHQSVVKSRSHNTLLQRNSNELLPGQIQHCPLPQFSEYFGLDFTESRQTSTAKETESVVPEENVTFKSIQSGNIKRMMNRLDSFFVMDEDSFANSPKRIVNQPSECNSLKPSLLISTPDQNIYEKHFLVESQKNAVVSITTKAEQPAQKQSDKFAKSNSCDSLDYFRLQTLSKQKSETDVRSDAQDDAGNELAGILHLEEEAHEEESMFNRFRKTFSLRFSKQWSSASKEAQEGPTKDHCVTLDSSVIISEESHDLNQCDISDINQNRIYRNKNFESDSFAGKMSTIERRKSRQDMFNRKSFRRNSRKNLRLKRSHSQPNDKSDNQISPNTDRSVDSDFDCKKSPSSDTKSSSQLNDSQENNDEVIYAEAIWKYSGEDNEELSFEAGDLIDVTDTSHKEWWWGAVKTKDETRYGWFPASYVRLKVSQEETMEEALANEDPELTPKKRMSMSKLSSEQIRANIVLEIINTERDFVKNLKDVVDGYLKPCRDRSDMFDETRISTIFGNIEELCGFQQKFLNELEQCVNWENLSLSQIGDCFLNNEKEFRVYCEFCKNHPLAINELQDLFTDHKFVVFFEGCRLLQNMIDISLDGFLLTPIQKICKYPLQLGELLKYTRCDHRDYEPVVNAHGCMQRVAQLVNERKRRFESLEQLITLQESFENWEGPALLDSCSLFVHSGEVTRITSSSWSKDVTLMLFDRLLVLCKKDTGILKKGTFIFKSRIDLDHVDSVVALEDNTKDVHFNVATKNAFKLFYKLKQKWYLFQAKSSTDKEKWIRSFEEERQRVRDDEEQGFFVSEQDKKGARIAHQNHLKPKKPRARRPYVKAKKPDTVIAEIPLGPVNGFEIDRNRAGSLPSYIYQEKQSLNLYKHRQSTMHNKKSRSNWFQLGSNKKSRLKRNLK